MINEFYRLPEATIIQGLFDRKVNPGLLFHDDFAEGAAVPWKVTSGTGVLSRTAAAAEFNQGGAAMKLTTSTVASEACEVHRYLGKKGVAKKVYFGGTFSIMDEAIANVGFYLGFRDGTNWQRAKLLHNLATNTWQYDAGGAGAQSLVTLLTRDPSENTNVPRWHHFLIGVDFATLKHVHMSLNEVDFPAVDGVDLRVAADATVPNVLDFAIETTNLGGTPAAGVILFDELFAFMAN